MADSDIVTDSGNKYVKIFWIIFKGSCLTSSHMQFN